MNKPRSYVWRLENGERVLAYAEAPDDAQVSRRFGFLVQRLKKQTFVFAGEETLDLTPVRSVFAFRFAACQASSPAMDSTRAVFGSMGLRGSA